MLFKPTLSAARLIISALVIFASGFNIAAIADDYMNRKSMSECSLALTKLKIGRTYRIKLGATIGPGFKPVPQFSSVAELTNISSSGVYEFCERSSGDRISLCESDLYWHFYFAFDRLIAPSIASSQSTSFLEKIIKWQPYWRPHQLVQDRPNFRVVKKMKTTADFADNIIADIEKIDGEMQAAGFRLPSFTKVILNGEILPGGGSSQISKNAFELKHQSFGDVIYFPGNEFESKYPQSTAMHERTHSILDGHYQELALINSRKTLSESFADVIPALILDYPIVGLEDAPLRRLDTAWANPATTELQGEHFYSLMTSNFLWRLKDRMGKEKLIRYLKPLMDSMNANAIELSASPIDERNFVVANLLNIVEDPADQTIVKDIIREGLMGVVANPERAWEPILQMTQVEYSDIAELASRLRSRNDPRFDAKERGEGKPATGRRSYLMNLFYLLTGF